MQAARSEPSNLRRSVVESPLLVAEELVARPELAPRGDIVRQKLVITLGGAFEFQVGRSTTWVDSSRLLFAYPGERKMMVVSFTQDYRSNNLSNRTHKRLYWIHEYGRWRILHEAVVS